LFDLTASILVLLGFLVFRWAVIAAPIIGTVALLRPASAGFRRLVNAVVAALFNVIIFGTGAAVYLFAVDTVMNTATIPGWLQVVLVFLTGLVGWLLLRPYRRITQLGGKDPLAAIAAGGVFNRRQAQIEQASATAVAARPDRSAVPVVSDRPPVRVELRADPPIDNGVGRPALAPAQAPTTVEVPSRPHREVPPDPANYGDTVYRPARTGETLVPVERSAARTRIEARAEP
jgi:hypothetical protein